MNLEIQNWFQSPPNNLCKVCSQEMKSLRSTCFNCGDTIHLNTCSYILLPKDVEKKPWLANAVGKNVCLMCMPRIQNASENYIRKIFAEIFSPSNETESENLELSNDSVEDQQPIIQEQKIYPENQSTLLDKLIGGVLYNLAIDNNLKYDTDGNLSEESMKDIKNSFVGFLYNSNLI